MQLDPSTTLLATTGSEDLAVDSEFNIPAVTYREKERTRKRLRYKTEIKEVDCIKAIKISCAARLKKLVKSTYDTAAEKCQSRRTVFSGRRMTISEPRRRSGKESHVGVWRMRYDG
ncbi:hypothetical protein BGX29_007542 [Mortierella sp. GBA35]|nr:hypothetical protein BGX23_004866 [Mortierella sp. AD031]KAF9107036.1 hypothetical protein BGX29_007542 [Mortierella sp. GBA35]